MNEQPFWKPQPVAPDDNRQMRGLRWSLRISVLGWIVYGAFAYVFEDVGVIPGTVQSWMVLLGSLLIVAGAESNTIATTEAALSKLGTDRISGWDFAAVVASLVGGICTPLITFSTRQTGLSATWWRQVAIQQGPLILGMAGVLDFYGAVTELALSKRDYERDMDRWLDEERQYNDEHGIRPVREPMPSAKIADFERVLGRMNGQRATLTAEQLADELAADDLGLPSESTVKRWLARAREVN